MKLILPALLLAVAFSAPACTTKVYNHDTPDHNTTVIERPVDNGKPDVQNNIKVDR